jgi:DNA topoisomerase VI subunit B
MVSVAHPSLPPAFQRTTVEMSREAEYFTIRELQTLTGQASDRFTAVIVKELMDNALDACETARIAPLIHVAWVPDHYREQAQLTITDNGPGLPRATVRRILHFATRTSDKVIYRAPTRGAQGNALKTVLGIPWALGIRAPLEIEAQGRLHTIRVDVDPAGQVQVAHTDTASVRRPGTRVSLTVSTQDQDCDVRHWGRAFALFNPHASVQIRQGETVSLPKVTRRGGGGGCGGFAPRLGGLP